eukprot:scaffold21158_cov71-Cyclotella_meneghiniana.AAC.7
MEKGWEAGAVDDAGVGAAELASARGFLDWGTVRIVSVGINVGGSTGNSNVDIAIIGATDVGMSGVGDASIGNAGVVGTGVGGGGASVEVVGVGVACGRSIGVGVAGGSSTSVQRWHWQRRRGWGTCWRLARLGCLLLAEEDMVLDWLD